MKVVVIFAALVGLVVAQEAAPRYSCPEYDVNLNGNDLGFADTATWEDCGKRALIFSQTNWVKCNAQRPAYGPQEYGIAEQILIFWLVHWDIARLRGQPSPPMWYIFSASALYLVRYI